MERVRIPIDSILSQKERWKVEGHGKVSDEGLTINIDRSLRGKFHIKF